METECESREWWAIYRKYAWVWIGFFLFSGEELAIMYHRRGITEIG